MKKDLDSVSAQLTMNRLLQACLREKLLSYDVQNNIFIIPLNQTNQFLSIKEVKQISLSRFEFSNEIYLFNKNKANPILVDDPHYLLSLIKNELKTSFDLHYLEQFQQEVDNHQKNLVVSLLYFQKYQSKITLKIKKANLQYLYQWAVTYETHPDLFFDRCMIQGHPTHPCSKIKLGFSLKENLKYSNEFDRDIKLFIAAIHKNHVHIESMKKNFDYHVWFKTTYPTHFTDFQMELKKLGKNIDDYVPLPIHPWQAKNKIPLHFQKFLDEKLLILFPGLRLKTKSTSSFRTLTATENRVSPHIKLPVAILATGAIRTLSAASTENNPKISNIMEEILKRENHFNQSLRCLSEFFGLHILSDPPKDQRLCSVIFRENPNQHLQENEMAITVAALFERSPLNDQPIFVEILLMNQIDHLNKAIAFFIDYVSIVLNAYLDLYLVYGIALEAHQQNTLVIFKDAKPVAMLSRDYSGIRIHLKSLQSQGYELILHPDSVIVCKNRIDARNKFLHTVYQSHLGEWVKALSFYFKADESLFWSIIRTITIEKFDAVKNRMPKEAWKSERKAFLETDWPVKALMRMRLCNQSHEYIFVNCKNPLHESMN